MCLKFGYSGYLHFISVKVGCKTDGNDVHVGWNFMLLIQKSKQYSQLALGTHVYIATVTVKITVRS